MPALYVDDVRGFLRIHPEQFVGKLTEGLANEGFDTTTLTTFSWLREITELQEAFRKLSDLLPAAGLWSVLFEYVLPIVGQRVDCVLLANDIIFAIEYKGGNAAGSRAALLQAQEYALNLVDFHEASRGRTAIPLAVGTFRTRIPLDVTSEHQGAAVSPAELPETIIRSYATWGGKLPAISENCWNNSRYFPFRPSFRRHPRYTATTT
jgi:hypothetical protein